MTEYHNIYLQIWSEGQLYLKSINFLLKILVVGHLTSPKSKIEHLK